MSYVGGISCCLGAVAFYFISRSYNREGDFLKSVTRINQLKDLSELLDTACNALVSVTGKIGSDTPIKCKYSDYRGVFLEEWVEQYYRKKCTTCDQDKWKDGNPVSKVVRREDVPWYLGDGTGRVCLANAYSGTRFGYSLCRTTSKIVERPDLSLVYQIKDECAKCGADLNIKIRESKRFEKILPVGTSLTVIGEAVKDNKGAIQIQRTKNGSFYAGSTSIDERINHSEWEERSSKRIALVFAGIGVILIAEPTIRYISGKLRAWFLQRRERRRRVAADIRRLSELQGRVEPAPAPIFDPRNYVIAAPAPILNPGNNVPAAVAPILNPEYNVPFPSAPMLNEENDVPAAPMPILNPESNVPVPSAPMLNKENNVSPNAEQDLVHDTCVVCQEQEYSMVFVPCGHLCCCTTCSSLLTECPLCRQNISEAVRTYRP